MDNPNVLIIVTAVALVLMIYVIRYIISRVLHKGADAIENRIRQVHLEKHPAENQSLVPNSDRPVSFCAKCGAELKPGSTFCAECGAELKKN